MTKIVDNRGDGFDDLYGTRNLRPILHGVAYRGGANNYYHKTNKRKNNNPLPKDGLQNLCTEGFSFYLLIQNQLDLWKKANPAIVLTIQKINSLIHSSITSKESIFVK